MPEKYLMIKVEKKTGELLGNVKVKDTDGKMIDRIVSIDATDADTLNDDWNRTGIKFVPAEKTGKEKRAELFAEITELGGSMPKNSPTEALEIELKKLKNK